MPQKMKTKIIIPVMLFTLLPLLPFAQSRCTKGAWIFGLNPVNYSVFNKTKTTHYSFDTVLWTGTSISNGISIGYNIGAGYFVRDNFCIGTGFGTNNIGSIEGSPFFSTDLFARYYLMQRKHCFSFTREDNTRKYAFFIQGVILGSYFKNSEKTNSNYIINNYTITNKSDRSRYIYGIQAAGGYTHILAKHVAIEFITVYNISKAGSTEKKVNIYEMNPVTKSASIHSTLNLLFGTQIYF